MDLHEVLTTPISPEQIIEKVEALPEEHLISLLPHGSYTKIAEAMNRKRGRKKKLYSPALIAFDISTGNKAVIKEARKQLADFYIMKIIPLRAPFKNIKYSRPAAQAYKNAIKEMEKRRKQLMILAATRKDLFKSKYLKEAIELSAFIRFFQDKIK